MPSWHCSRTSRPPVHGGEGPGDLGLADAGVALEQERALEPQGEEDGRGQPLVGEVVLRAEPGDDVVDRGGVA